MRFLYVCAAVALTASSAFAQSQYADSTGGYLALHNLGFGSDYQRYADGVVGYRLGGGRDVGLRLGYSSSTLRNSTSGGPVIGYTRPLGRGLTGRIEGALRYESSRSDYPASTIPIPEGTIALAGGRYAERSLAQDVTASASRSVRLIGSLRLRPTVGVFASAKQRLTLDVPEQFENRRIDRTVGNAGLHFELPLTFRLFGQDASFTAVGRLPLMGDRNGMPNVAPAYAGGGLRLNF